MPAPFVTRELFRFLAELRHHNDRDWFNANKDRYLGEVRDPLLGFIAAIAPKLAAISPHIGADPRPSGGSLMRPYRDTRFARDKTPYKTNAALSFRLAPKRDVESPGYYLHLEPGMVFTIEPGIYQLEKFGVRIEDDCVMTENGVELLSQRAAKL